MITSQTADRLESCTSQQAVSLFLPVCLRVFPGVISEALETSSGVQNGISYVNRRLIEVAS